MTNYEWLLQMGGEERQAWFDAEHVDVNDALTRKGDVREDDVCANDGFMDLDSCTHGVRTFASETDSREKLEVDASELVADYAASGDVCDALHCGIVALLDRQAAITAEETSGAWEEYRDATQREIAELTAERDALADDLLTCNKEREEYRRKLSEVLDLIYKAYHVGSGAYD